MKEKKYALLDVKAVVLQHYLDYLFAKAFSGLTKIKAKHTQRVPAVSLKCHNIMSRPYACQPPYKLV